ncbi:hypothetical protein DMR31_07670 [Klebsiella variicola]|nr:hypothetical protein DMR31_07670 [Klebsiella variicola]
MTGIFISTTLFALFASMLIGLGMVWKGISNTPITDSFVRRCCSPSAAAGQYLAPFLSKTTPGFAQARSHRGSAPAQRIFEIAIHTVNKLL